MMELHKLCTTVQTQHHAHGDHAPRFDAANAETSSRYDSRSQIVNSKGLNLKLIMVVMSRRRLRFLVQLT